MDAPQLTDQDKADGYTVQVWLFGGLRFIDEKKFGAWLPVDGINEKGIEHAKEQYWSVTGTTHFPVGGEYWVKAREDAKNWWRRGDPIYRGLHDDRRVRAILNARHKAAETAIETKRRLDKDRKDSPLEDALDLIQEAYHNVIHPQRAAFLAYVTRRITHGGK